MLIKILSKLKFQWAVKYIVMLVIVVGTAVLFKDKMRGIILANLGDMECRDVGNGFSQAGICMPVAYWERNDREVANEDSKCLEACVFSTKGKVSCHCVNHHGN